MDSQFNLNNIDEMGRDILGEIGNIGMGKVATSLSKILDKAIGISVPKVKIVGLSELDETLGMAEERVAGILFQVSTDIEGMMMFVLQEQFAKEVIEVLMGTKVEELDALDEINTSVLQEVANIMAGAYMSAISELTEFSINLSVPYLAIDMLGAIMNIPAVEFGEVGDKILLIEETILGQGKDYDCYLMLIPTPDSLKKLLNKVGGVYGYSC